LGRDPTLEAARQALDQRREDPTFALAEAPVRQLLAAVRARVATATADQVE
jgi:hypothetical protein